MMLTVFAHLKFAAHEDFIIIIFFPDFDLGLFCFCSACEDRGAS